MKNKKTIFLIFFLFFSILFFLFISINKKNLDFEINKYTCENCQMLISDFKFRYQIINKNKKSFKFDDINCMFLWLNKNDMLKTESVMWGVDYFENKWIKLYEAIIINKKNIKTPMNSNIIIFKNEKNLNKFKNKKILNLKEYFIKKNK